MGRVIQYCYQDPLDILQHLVVPKTHDREALRPEPSISRSIFFSLFGMLSTVYLNDQLPIQANKIDNISSQRLLSSEFHPAKLFSSQRSPQQSFRIG